MSSGTPQSGDETELHASDHALQCMEIIGGNRALRQTVDAPGLKIWIDSRPLGSGGGDVHYVSTCGAGYVTRLALADISGHGESVDRLAVALRKLMRKHINTLDQTRFARSLNRELTALDQSGRFATAVLATYFAPTRHLILCNAGHPRPLWYSAKHDQWQYLDLESAGDCPTLRSSRTRYHMERLANLPLGVLDPIRYEQFAVELSHGDVVLLCTDAVTECSDDSGDLLGEAGLLALGRQLGSIDRGRIGERLVDAIESRRNGRAAADDQTLIVLEHSDTGPPRPSLARTVRTLAKMIGLSRV
jgi:sigma-B regulation protein RsbU (phosphoserine phosphatase)